MQHLRERGPSAQQTLVELLGIDATNLVAILNSLDDAGLIERRRDRTDRRRAIIALSPNGERLLANLDRALGRDRRRGLRPTHIHGARDPQRSAGASRRPHRHRLLTSARRNLLAPSAADAIARAAFGGYGLETLVRCIAEVSAGPPLGWVEAGARVADTRPMPVPASNMLTRFRPRLSYANVVATAAVFLSLGGGAYAALGTDQTDNHVFHGCVDRSSGVLRVVSSARLCHPPERSGTETSGFGWQANSQSLGAGPAPWGRGHPGRGRAAWPVRSQRSSGRARIRRAVSDIPATREDADRRLSHRRGEQGRPGGHKSFAYPLASAPTVHFVGIGTVAPAECPGPRLTRRPLRAICASTPCSARAAPTWSRSRTRETNLPGASERRIHGRGETSSGSWAVTAP